MWKPRWEILEQSNGGRVQMPSRLSEELGIKLNPDNVKRQVAISGEEDHQWQSVRLFPPKWEVADQSNRGNLSLHPKGRPASGALRPHASRS